MQIIYNKIFYEFKILYNSLVLFLCILCCCSSDYVLKPNTTLNINNDIYPHSEAGPGVIDALWKLTLAMIFKTLITIFTFGMKVSQSILFQVFY